MTEESETKANPDTQWEEDKELAFSTDPEQKWRCRPESLITPKPPPELMPKCPPAIWRSTVLPSNENTALGTLPVSPPTCQPMSHAEIKQAHFWDGSSPCSHHDDRPSVLTRLAKEGDYAALLFLNKEAG